MLLHYHFMKRIEILYAFPILLAFLCTYLGTVSQAFTIHNRIILHSAPQSSKYHIIKRIQWRNQDRNTLSLSSRTEDDDDDDEDDEDDYINLPSSASLPNLSSKPISFGPGRGRSAPSQRKAMGKSNASSTTVHVCTNCSAEYVNWVGRCSTCHEWNTVQEFQVGRKTSRGGGGGGSVSGGKPVFRRGTGGLGGESNKSKPASWLTGVDDYNHDGGNSYLPGMEQQEYQPVSITDVYKQMGYKKGDAGKDGGDNLGTFREHRVQIPFDEELNNVLGGGIMPGSLTLLGGDPGVGKSTLLLQTAGQVASLSSPPRKIGYGKDDSDSNASGVGPVLYVSGEENAMQIASRSIRLGIEESELLLLCETDADYIAQTVVMYSNDSQMQNWNNEEEENEKDGILGRRRQPSLLIIDSIQTMICENGGSSSAGGVTQVRECVGLFLRLAKSTGVPIILVGHVTKTGGVAGPRTVEHMVDAVLYLEGCNYVGGGPNLRMLRAAKNRFGSSEEVGVYSSTSASGGRLIPVSDPSSLFLANREDSEDLEGCAISLVLEGIRPMTVEVQALVTSAGPPAFVGRRTVDGISLARLQLILAVLQKRCGIFFGRQDVYINVVGGINLKNSKQDGTSSDLAIAVALVSSLYNIPIRSDTAFVGEIGLLGEMRQVQSLEKRVNEARRMGFSSVVVPKQQVEKKGMGYGNTRSLQSLTRGIACIEAKSLMEAIEKGLTSKIPKNKAKGKAYKKSESGGKQSPPMYNDELEDLIIDDDNEDDDDFGFQ
jgi:DNA repair protein RadA/Sms